MVLLYYFTYIDDARSDTNQVLILVGFRLSTYTRQCYTRRLRSPVCPSVLLFVCAPMRLSVFPSFRDVLSMTITSRRLAGYSQYDSIQNVYKKMWVRKMYQLDANNFTMIFSHKWPLHVSDIYMSIFRSSYIQVVSLPHVVLCHRC